jgi:predicted nucleotidyltransferase
MNLQQLQGHREEILRLAQQYHSANIRVFGSVARGEAADESDVDFLIDVTPEQDLFDFIRFTRSLKELLGCEVDVVHSSALHHSIREQVLQEAIPL